MTETIQVNGRHRLSLLKKLNPIWWFGNDSQQTVDQARWYHPDWPETRRKLYWSLRNPLQNFRSSVLGIEDKNYTLKGRAPVLTIQRDDLPGQHGWQWCVQYGGDLWLPRGFISYSGKWFVWQLGWQPSGFFGLKLNIHT